MLHTAPEASLQRVLAATQALEATLEPLDVEAFRRALAARAAAIEELAADVRSDGAAGALESLQELASVTAEADRRVREQAAAALAGLRDELRGLVAAQNGLTGYRPSPPNLPRFADRKG